MPSGDPVETITKALESARNVRLGRGVVSKTSYIAVTLLVVWAVVAWRWSESLMLNAGLLIIGLVATVFAVWFIHGTRRFAERNPALALLEGAELLEWRKMEVAAKGMSPSKGGPFLEDRGGTPPIEKLGK